MPVVNISRSRLERFLPGVSFERAIEVLPFVGLDIEGTEGDTARIEYNPNRPDFSSDYGIFRSLRGIMNVETGLPKYRITRSEASVTVDGRTRKMRPEIVALVAKGGKLDDESIKQLIAMQEDLHEGIGRRRRKASLGLHNLDAIRFPVKYTVAGSDYSFIPLGESSKTTIAEFMEKTEMGRKYGGIVGGGVYPIVVDRDQNLLSVPPVVNGNATMVDKTTRNIFVEVTATGRKVASDVLAIIAAALSDAGFAIGSVLIKAHGRAFRTPVMDAQMVSAELGYINSVLGLDLKARQISECLQKSRLGAAVRGDRVICQVPRFRTDISDPIDIAEEVAIGYGIYNFEPSLPASRTAGSTSSLTAQIQAARETLVGLGMIEVLNFSLVGRDLEYGTFEKTPADALDVSEPKSSEHQTLRKSLIPSLLQSLSRNVHEEYPQRLFEIGKVFASDKGISESWRVGALIAHADAGFTESKSVLQALALSGFGRAVKTRPSSSPFFIKGRSAEVLIDERPVGSIGEIVPAALERLKMRVPVAGFELQLDGLAGSQEKEKNS